MQIPFASSESEVLRRLCAYLPPRPFIDAMKNRLVEMHQARGDTWTGPEIENLKKTPRRKNRSPPPSITARAIPVQFALQRPPQSRKARSHLVQGRSSDSPPSRSLTAFSLASRFFEKRWQAMALQKKERRTRLFSIAGGTQRPDRPGIAFARKTHRSSLLLTWQNPSESPSTLKNLSAFHRLSRASRVSIRD